MKRLLDGSSRLYNPEEAGNRSNPALSVSEKRSRLEEHKPGKYRAFSN